MHARVCVLLRGRRQEDNGCVADCMLCWHLDRCLCPGRTGHTCVHLDACTAWLAHCLLFCPLPPPQLVMNVPYTALNFTAYESMKKFLVGSTPARSAAAAAAAGDAASSGGGGERLPSGAGRLLTAASAQPASSVGGGAAVQQQEEQGEEEEGLRVQLLAGGVAGGLAAAATTPLDVVKTRLQLEGLSSATRYNTTSVVS